MSFNTPFFDFFDAINNEVDNFNKYIGARPYNAYDSKRQRLTNKEEKGNHDNQLVKSNGNSVYFPRYAGFEDLDDWFDNDFSLIPTGFTTQRNATVPVDILDHEKNYEIKVVVPGVKDKKDINLEYHKEKNQIVISGEIPHTLTEETKDKVKVNESFSGKFKRTVTLPKSPGIDADNIKADYASGVLSLTVPKLEPGKGEKDQIQKIEISSQESWGN